MAQILTHCLVSSPLFENKPLKSEMFSSLLQAC